MKIINDPLHAKRNWTTRLTARCCVCRGRFTYPEWDDRHDIGPDVAHAACCTECSTCD